MNLRKAMYKRVDWIQLAQDMIHLRSPKNAEAFSNVVYVSLAVKPMDVERERMRVGGPHSLLFRPNTCRSTAQATNCIHRSPPPPQGFILFGLFAFLRKGYRLNNFELVDKFREFQ
jgi:hypothetical protein